MEIIEFDKFWPHACYLMVSLNGSSEYDQLAFIAVCQYCLTDITMLNTCPRIACQALAILNDKQF